MKALRLYVEGMKQKLSTYADREGIPLRTAQRHAAAGMIPGAVQSETGRWYILGESPDTTDHPSSSTLQAILRRLTSIESKLDHSVELSVLQG